MMGKSRGKHRSPSDDLEPSKKKRGTVASPKRMSRNATNQWTRLIDEELEAQEDGFEVEGNLHHQWEDAS